MQIQILQFDFIQVSLNYDFLSCNCNSQCDFISQNCKFMSHNCDFISYLKLKLKMTYLCFILRRTQASIFDQ